MELVTPAIGLIFWMSVTFFLVMFILKKFAWKPILGALKDREESIEKALQSAENARSEMQKLQSQNEALLAEARTERDKILREAREMKEKMISDAKSMADDEAKKLIARANEEINKQKSAAIEELKKQVATFSVEIAEKIVKRKLESNDEQRALINDYLTDLGQKQASA